MIKKDDRLIENIRHALDQSLEDLDGATCSRLTQARHLAMERRQEKSSRFLYWGAAPVAGLMLFVLLLNWQVAPINPVAVPQVEDVGIFTASEPLEFYQEEIEFYEWLSEVLDAEKELSDHGDSGSGVPVADRSVDTGALYVGTTESRNVGFPRII